MSNSWNSRIVGHGKVAADQLLANPFNHRRHPQKQREVVNASINEIGVVKSVQVNVTTGRILDGHERVMQALDRGDGTLVDVEYVELTEAEEKKALLILDASSELATIDTDNLESLLRDVQTGEQALADMMAEMARDNGIVPPDFGPGTLDDQGQLDQLSSKKVRCPNCQEEFDCRGQI